MQGSKYNVRLLFAALLLAYGRVDNLVALLLDVIDARKDQRSIGNARRGALQLTQLGLHQHMIDQVGIFSRKGTVCNRRGEGRLDRIPQVLRSASRRNRADQLTA